MRDMIDTSAPVGAKLSNRYNWDTMLPRGAFQYWEGS
jgi:hypothetical protein